MKRTLSLLLLCGLLVLLTVQTSHWSWTTQAQQQHSEIKIDPKAFDEFVGQYALVSNPDFIFSFWREGDKFFMQPTNQGKIEIFPETETRFFLKVFEAQTTFVRDAQGKVTSAVWRQGNQDNQLKKISSQPAMEVNKKFEKREEMIPMRDGVRLHTLIFTPEHQAETLPIVIDRTPYGIDEATS